MLAQLLEPPYTRTGGHVDVHGGSRHHNFDLRSAKCLEDTPRKPIELPPEVARAFVRDMRAFHAAKNSLTKDEIAAKQLWMLKQQWNDKLRITDVREMFEQMKDHA